MRHYLYSIITLSIFLCFIFANVAIVHAIAPTPMVTLDQTTMEVNEDDEIIVSGTVSLAMGQKITSRLGSSSNPVISETTVPDTGEHSAFQIQIPNSELELGENVVSIKSEPVQGALNGSNPKTITITVIAAAPVSGTAAYKPVIDEYVDCLQKIDTGAVDPYELDQYGYHYINENIVLCALDPNYTGGDKSIPEYAFIDINKDGTKELVIGDKEGYEEWASSSGYAIGSIFTLDKNKKPTALIESSSYRYRQYINIYTEGTIEDGGSSGYQSHRYIFYEIDSSTATLTVKNELIAYDGNYTHNNQAVTEDKFYELRDNLENSTKVTLQWHNFGSNEYSDEEDDENNSTISNELDFEKDIWNFENYGHKTCQLEDEDNPCPYLKSLSPKTRGTIQSKIKKDRSDTAHCFGMSATVILNKLGIDDMTQWDNVTCLRQVDEKSKVPSYRRCFYHLTQFFPEYCQAEDDFARYSAAEKLSILARLADKVKDGGNPVLLSFSQSPDFAHTVVAYAVENGLFYLYGTTYDHRIKVYDPNYTSEPNDLMSGYYDFCLYYNEGTDEWVIPNSGGHSISPDSGGTITLASDDTSLFDAKENLVVNHQPVLFLSIDEDVVIKCKDTDEQWTVNVSTGEVNGTSNLHSYYDSESDLRIILPHEGTYEIKQIGNTAAKLDAQIMSSKTFLGVSAASALGATISTSGSLSLMGNQGDYLLSAADNRLEGKGNYDNFFITGDGEGNTTVSLKDDGISLDGDNLQGNVLEASNASDSSTITVEETNHAEYPCHAEDYGDGHMHKWGQQTTKKPATEIAAGLMTYTCSVCGTTKEATIKMLAPTLKPVKIKKPKASKKAATIKWKKVSKKNRKKTKKIQIQYSTSKTFNTEVKTKYASAKKTSKKIKGLKKGKIYYVRVRAYTQAGSAVHVSKWSAMKSFKVK